jgi:glycosyltransferase involved in cell wall biosynthesis
MKRIVSEGHEVTVLCSRYHGSKTNETVNGIKVIRLGGKLSFPLYAFLYYVTRLKKENLIIVDDVSKIPLMAPIYIWNKPLITIIHHIHGLTLFKELPWPVALVTFLAERAFLLPYLRVSRIITVSDSTKRELMAIGIPSAKIEVIHNGLPQNLFPGQKAKDPLVIYLGRVKRYKQINHLLKAFKLVKDKLPSAGLIIGGRGSKKIYSELENLANELGLISNVRFLGEVSESEKLMLLQSAWVYVIPSMKEGWGISAAEAMACGTPVIAYNVPGLSDLVINGETGLLVPQMNPESLAQAILKVLKKSVMESMAEKSFMYSRQFNWDRAAKETLKIFSTLLNQPKSSPTSRG